MSPADQSVPNRRRSQRVFVQIPVVVRGNGPDNQAIEEKTQTLVVNAHGGLVMLSFNVRDGQKFILTNATTQQNQECRVVFLGPRQAGKMQVGVEFTRPAPNFWHIAFPPDDWSASPA